MPFGESEPRAGFEVPFEGDRLGFVVKSDEGLDLPGSEFGGVRHFASVVFGESGLVVMGESDIALVGIRKAAEDVDKAEA
jgi:hypothetical protein